MGVTTANQRYIEGFVAESAGYAVISQDAEEFNRKDPRLFDFTLQVDHGTAATVDIEVMGANRQWVDHTAAIGADQIVVISGAAYVAVRATFNTPGDDGKLYYTAYAKEKRF